MHQVTTSPEPIRVVSIADAADMIFRAERIMVIGCSGGGKSTLAQKLANHFDLTYLSIDRDIRWLPGWTQRSKKEQRQRVVDRIAGERWIMDGTNTSTFDIRLPRTDILIWVRMPRLLCVWGVITRWLSTSAAHVRKWRRAASKRSIGNFWNSSGLSRKKLRRASQPRSLLTGRMCPFYR